MITKKLFIVGLLLTSFTFLACDNTTGNNEDNVRVIENSKDIVISEAQNVAAFTLNVTSEVVTDFEDFKSGKYDGLGKVTNPDRIYRWNPETMWHTWTLKTEGENLSGTRFRAQQHLDAQGNIIKKGQDASGFIMYYINEGTYGYPDGSLSGTTWLHTMGTAENPVIGMVVGNSYVMTGSGSYHKIWTGDYKANETDEYELVTIDNGVDITVDQFVASRDENGNESVSFIGDISYVFADWNVSLSCDGGDTITGELTKGGVFIQNLEYKVSDLMTLAGSLLP
jgi:hypothetical protein